MLYISTSAVALAIALTSTSLFAKQPTRIGCEKKSTLAFLSIEAEVTSSVDQDNLSTPTCPLLEKKKLLKLVKKFASGTIFAYPLIPSSCVSGKILPGGTIQTINGDIIKIDPYSSYSESAQRLFPVPTVQGIPGLDGLNLFASPEDNTLQLGAAMTLLHIEGEGPKDKHIEFNLFLDDRFTVTNFGEDTEDLRIVGSQGKAKVSGRLTGKGQIISFQPFAIEFLISGNICLKGRQFKFKKQLNLNPHYFSNDRLFTFKNPPL